MNTILIFKLIDQLEDAKSIKDEETVFAKAQEVLSTSDYSKFTAIAPSSKFLDGPALNRV